MGYIESIKIHVVVILHFARLIFSNNEVRLLIDDEAKTCEKFHVNYLDENMYYSVWWSGGKPPNYCKLNFRGLGVDASDKYKVCVEIIVYTVLDCSTDVKFYFGNSNPDKIYNCINPPDLGKRECGGENKYFNIRVESRNRYANLNIYPSMFELNVTAVRTYDSPEKEEDFNSNVILGVMVALSIIAVLIVVCALVSLCRRKKQKPSAPVSQFNENTDIQTQNVGHTNINNETANRALLWHHEDQRRVEPTAPPSFNVTPSQHNQQNTQRTNDNRERTTTELFNDPPPSYEMVMRSITESKQ